tara:strand:+ start:340 stop:525 length:186 start_codon:yes stop_codon:yes gene_type:complete
LHEISQITFINKLIVTLSLLELRFPVIADIITADGSPLENIDEPLKDGLRYERRQGLQGLK